MMARWKKRESPSQAYGMFAIPEGEVELGMEQPTRLVQLIHMVMLDFGTVATGAI